MLKSYLITFFISMVPIVELRGAIPYGTLLCNPPVPLLQAYIISIIGNMLPVPIIFFFARKVLEWGADKPIIGGFFTWCLKKGHKGGEKLQAKAGRGLYVALLLFVGIPLPGGPAHLLLPSLIWILKKARSPLCAAFFLPASSSVSFPQLESMY